MDERESKYVSHELCQSPRRARTLVTAWRRGSCRCEAEVGGEHVERGCRKSGDDVELLTGCRRIGDGVKSVE
jgi:hypothetical protein